MIAGTLLLLNNVQFPHIFQDDFIDDGGRNPWPLSY